ELAHNGSFRRTPRRRRIPPASSKCLLIRAPKRSLVPQRRYSWGKAHKASRVSAILAKCFATIAAHYTRLHQFPDHGIINEMLRPTHRIDKRCACRVDPEVVIKRGENLLEVNRAFLGVFA